MPTKDTSRVDWNILAKYFPVVSKPAKSAKEKLFDKHMAQERGRALAALNKARKLAAPHGIEVERESASAYWVTCPKLGDNDPFVGNQFCSDGREVLETVEAYVEHLAKA